MDQYCAITNQTTSEVAIETPKRLLGIGDGLVAIGARAERGDRVSGSHRQSVATEKPARQTTYVYLCTTIPTTIDVDRRRTRLSRRRRRIQRQ